MEELMPKEISEGKKKKKEKDFKRKVNIFVVTREDIHEIEIGS